MPGLVLARLRRLLSPFEPTANRVIYYAYAAAWLGTVPFVCYGIIALWRKDHIATLVLLTPLLATVITACIFYGCIRFRDSVAPVFLVFAATGLADVLRYAGLIEYSSRRMNHSADGSIPS